MFNCFKSTKKRISLNISTANSFFLTSVILTTFVSSFNLKPAFAHTDSTSCLPVNLGLLGDYAMFATTSKMSISNSDTSIGSNGTGLKNSCNNYLIFAD